MKPSQTPGESGEQEQPSPFADLPAYPQHAEHTASGGPGHGDMPHPEYAPVMRYEITTDQVLEKTLCSIFDDSGTLRFTVARNRSICDPSGYELAAADRHPFRQQVDITRHGYTVASVRATRFGIGEHYTIDSPAGQFAANGHFLTHNYTLTGPGGSALATVTQQGLRESIDVEIEPGQDDVLLLAAILAIEDIADHKMHQGTPIT
jgi:hypothetical protein